MKRYSKFLGMSYFIVSLVVVFCFAMLFASPVLAVEKGTGTDPRDFSNKFMPYHLYINLENDMEIHETHLFGLYAITPKFAITYDLPVVKNIDWDKSDSGLPMDLEETGMGDLNLRVFATLGEEKFLGMSWLAGAEINLPTHTEDALGSDQMTAGPMLVNVYDATFLPMPGAFLAMMHITNFDIYGDDDEDDVALYKGRWFFMTPLNEKHKIYSLVEMQPIYDFEDDEFSFWIAPEFGKMFSWGPVYVKPGWGIDNNEETDREFTFEIGLRYFM
ncbi:MAG: hypothetical protein ACYSSP_13845 [Planctomycetota bacterium]|jgi:hypothetical protein